MRELMCVWVVCTHPGGWNRVYLTTTNINNKHQKLIISISLKNYTSLGAHEETDEIDVIKVTKLAITHTSDENHTYTHSSMNMDE